MRYDGTYFSNLIWCMGLSEQKVYTKGCSNGEHFLRSTTFFGDLIFGQPAWIFQPFKDYGNINVDIHTNYQWEMLQQWYFWAQKKAQNQKLNENSQMDLVSSNHAANYLKAFTTISGISSPFTYPLLIKPGSSPGSIPQMYWFIYPVCWFPTFSSKMNRSLTKSRVLAGYSIFMGIESSS